MAKYMHLINRQPAFFDGECLCYIGKNRSLTEVLVTDLPTIRRQQALSRSNYKRIGVDTASDVYGYLCFRE